MAKIVSEALIIEISRISKDNENLEPILDQDIAATLEQVVKELVGEATVVEVIIQPEK